MTLKKDSLLSKNISSKKLNTEMNLQFDRGFSPVLSPVYDGDRVVLQITDWIGGEGEAPFDPTLTSYYLGATDFVTDISNAIDIAEGYMSSAYLTRLIDADTVSIVLGDDGYFYLQYNDFANSILSTPSVQTTLQEYMFSNNFDLSPQSGKFGATQNAIYNAINNARSRYTIPIITLDAAKMSEVESLIGLSPDNPYFAMVGVDDRTTGVVGVCALGGYEGMCSPAEIDGVTCTAQVDWVEAQWLVTVTNAGNPGEVIQIVIDGNTIGQYTVRIGDTTTDIASALASYIVNHYGSHDFNAGWNSDNTLNVIAPLRSGVNANSWSESIVGNGVVNGTISQVISGVDFKPRTCTGVEGHFIGYDGTTWYDFGVSFSNNIAPSDHLGTIYYIQAGNTFETNPYTQYIVKEQLIVMGTFILGFDSQLIIL